MAENETGIGIVGLDHVGITVPDLELATRFFVDVLGFQAEARLGPIKSEDSDWMAVNLDADPRAILHIQIVSGPAGKVELFGFDEKGGNVRFPGRADNGATSLGLNVTDLDQAVQRLSAAGVTVLGDFKSVPDGPNAGLRWVYVKAPWGQLLFLQQRPNA